MMAAESIVQSDSAECPYCTSQTTLIVYNSGRLEVLHDEPFGPRCETGLWRLISEQAEVASLRAMRRN
jgi:hypothetical protein